MGFNIQKAISATDFEQVGRLYRAFSDWQAATYQDVNYLLEDFYAAIESDIAALPGEYGPPSGCLLLAWVEGVAAGTVALKDCGSRICEMKRMFVLAGSQGQGIGRALVENLLEEARKLGYVRMRLETGPRQLAAQKLYAAMGFQEIEPYYDLGIPEEVFAQLPQDIQRGLIFMEYRL